MRRRRSPEIIAGRVGGTGNIVTGGDSFNSRQTGTGTYEVTFPANFRVVSMVCTSESGGRVVTSVFQGSNQVTVLSYVANTLALDNQPFAFVAVGYSL